MKMIMRMVMVMVMIEDDDDDGDGDELLCCWLALLLCRWQHV